MNEPLYYCCPECVNGHKENPFKKGRWMPMTTKTKKTYRKPDYLFYKERKKGTLVHQFAVMDEYGIINTESLTTDKQDAKAYAASLSKNSFGYRYFPIHLSARVVK